MKYCIHCGHPLNDPDKFCVRCGKAQPQRPPEFAPPVPVPEAPLAPAMRGADAPVPVGETNLPEIPAAMEFPKKRSPLPLLIWSILMIFVLNPVGTPLAIAATYFGVLANASDEAPQDADRHIEMGFTLCLISTCTDVLCILALAAVAFLAARGAGIP